MTMQRPGPVVPSGRPRQRGALQLAVEDVAPWNWLEGAKPQGEELVSARGWAAAGKRGLGEWGVEDV